MFEVVLRSNDFSLVHGDVASRVTLAGSYPHPINGLGQYHAWCTEHCTLPVMHDRAVPFSELRTH